MISVGGKTFTVDELSLGQCLQCLLQTAYQYYHRYTSLIPDEDFDALARRLLNGWDDFEHMHKHLVSPDDLRAGTLYALPAKDYPERVIAASEMWSREAFHEDSQAGKDLGE